MTSLTRYKILPRVCSMSTTAPNREENHDFFDESTHPPTANAFDPTCWHLPITSLPFQMHGYLLYSRSINFIEPYVFSPQIIRFQVSAKLSYRYRTSILLPPHEGLTRKPRATESYPRHNLGRIILHLKYNSLSHYLRPSLDPCSSPPAIWDEPP